MARARSLRFAADHGVVGAYASAVSAAPPALAETALGTDAWEADPWAGDWDLALRACKGRLDRLYIDLGRQDPRRINPSAQRFNLAPGTADSRLKAAMNRHQLDVALSAGRHAIERARLAGFGLIWAQGAGAGAIMTNAVWERWLHGFEGGLDLASDRALETGSDTRAGTCAPTSTASATPCPDQGNGDAAAAGLILHRHAEALRDPYEALRCLGGFEHAALVGSALAAAQLGVRWLALGTSARIALRLAMELNPSVAGWLEVTPCCSGCKTPHEIVRDSAVGRPASGLAR